MRRMRKQVLLHIFVSKQLLVCNFLLELCSTDIMGAQQTSRKFWNSTYHESIIISLTYFIFQIILFQQPQLSHLEERKYDGCILVDPAGLFHSLSKSFRYSVQAPQRLQSWVRPLQPLLPFHFLVEFSLSLVDLVLEWLCYLSHFSPQTPMTCFISGLT